MLAVIRDKVETPKHKDSRLQGCCFPGVLARVLAAIMDQVEAPNPRLQGCWFPGVLAKVLAVIRVPVATRKLKDFKASGLLVSSCPGQGVSGNKGPSGNP